ncbi:MAG TPA: hypothetical protein VF868_12730 [Bacteroidia bacterium]|jgi:hypothetical protein
MRKTLPLLLSFFLLSVFLFPMAEKQLHAFEHAGEIHCNAADKHFHEEEHVCSICDFTFTDSNNSTDAAFCFTQTETEFLYEPFKRNVHIPLIFSLLPSRAPPAAFNV